MSITKRIPPSLVQLSINTAIKNLSHIRDVGDTDITLLKEILNECTADQLSQIENASSKRRDLSLVTDGIWNRFYIQRFGARSARQEIMMLKLNEAPSINWKQIFYMKLKEVAKAEKKSKDKIKREILKEATVGKLKKSFNKACKKTGINAVFRNTRRTVKSVVASIIKVFDVALLWPIAAITILAGALAAVVTDLILGAIRLAVSSILISIRVIRNVIRSDSTY